MHRILENFQKFLHLRNPNCFLVFPYLHLSINSHAISLSFLIIRNLKATIILFQINLNINYSSDISTQNSNPIIAFKSNFNQFNLHSDVIQRYMTSNHLYIVRAFLFPKQDHPRTPKHQETRQNFLVSPGGCSSLPGSSTKPKNWVN